MEAAAETPISNSSSLAHASVSRSRTISRWERRVSSNWRTMSLPMRAVERQWMARRSSPGTYSRRAWKDTSAEDRSCVVAPSMSRMKPTVEAFMATVRG
jgi:hypothetical protein